jgi:hypothetical protein
MDEQDMISLTFDIRKSWSHYTSTIANIFRMLHDQVAVDNGYFRIKSPVSDKLLDAYITVIKFKYSEGKHDESSSNIYDNDNTEKKDDIVTCVFNAPFHTRIYNVEYDFDSSSHLTAKKSNPPRSLSTVDDSDDDDSNDDDYDDDNDDDDDDIVIDSSISILIGFNDDTISDELGQILKKIETDSGLNFLLGELPDDSKVIQVRHQIFDVFHTQDINPIAVRDLITRSVAIYDMYRCWFDDHRVNQPIESSTRINTENGLMMMSSLGSFLRDRIVNFPNTLRLRLDQRIFDKCKRIKIYTSYGRKIDDEHAKIWFKRPNEILQIMLHNLSNPDFDRIIDPLIEEFNLAGDRYVKKHIEIMDQTVKKSVALIDFDAIENYESYLGKNAEECLKMIITLFEHRKHHVINDIRTIIIDILDETPSENGVCLNISTLNFGGIGWCSAGSYHTIFDAEPKKIVMTVILEVSSPTYRYEPDADAKKMEELGFVNGGFKYPKGIQSSLTLTNSYINKRDYYKNTGYDCLFFENSDTIKHFCNTSVRSVSHGPETIREHDLRMANPNYKYWSSVFCPTFIAAIELVAKLTGDTRHTTRTLLRLKQLL